MIEAPLRPPEPSSAHASAVMRANRRSDTGPELRLQASLREFGASFVADHPVRLRDERVRVDIAFPVLMLAVFVDGCYWHGCPAHYRVPRSNQPYWTAKIERNRRRDAANEALLAEAGWSFVRVWEHEADGGVANVLGALSLRDKLAGAAPPESPPTETVPAGATSVSPTPRRVCG